MPRGNTNINNNTRNTSHNDFTSRNSNHESNPVVKATVKAIEIELYSEMDDLKKSIMDEFDKRFKEINTQLTLLNNKIDDISKEKNNYSFEHETGKSLAVIKEAINTFQMMMVMTGKNNSNMKDTPIKKE